MPLILQFLDYFSYFNIYTPWLYLLLSGDNIAQSIWIQVNWVLEMMEAELASKKWWILIQRQSLAQ